jgi:hypothetical protein
MVTLASSMNRPRSRGTGALEDFPMTHFPGMTLARFNRVSVNASAEDNPAGLELGTNSRKPL